MNSGGLTEKIKENLLSVGLVALAAIIAFRVYNAKDAELGALESQKTTETQKNLVLGDINGLEKKLSFLNEKINNKAPSASLDKIGDFAKTAQVKISKITPQKESSAGVYTRYPFDLSLTADDYHKIGKFVSLLENSPDIYIVDNLAIDSNSENPAEPVSATLTVYTIMVNK